MDKYQSVVIKEKLCGFLGSDFENVFIQCHKMGKE